MDQRIVSLLVFSTLRHAEIGIGGHVEKIVIGKPVENPQMSSIDNYDLDTISKQFLQV